MKIIFRSLLALSIITASGCSLNPKEEAGLKGGAIGAGVGAGTGAIVGSVITNGDIAASALLGGAIGLPIGVLAGIAYANSIENSVIDDNQAIIDRNSQEIITREGEIQSYRERLLQDSKAIELDESRKEFIYNGPTIGTYR